jgi:iduronate 2-sulfatase
MRWIFSAVVIASLGTAWAAEGSAPKMNVLFIVADDLRADLGCYGSVARTPNLDALAARALRFDRAYCQQALCNPSRSSFLTGKRPDSLHHWGNSEHFRDRNPDVMTLPLWFKNNGYDTRCVGKIFHNWVTKEKGDPRSWSGPEFLHFAQHGSDKPIVEGELPPNVALSIGRNYGEVPMCEARAVPDEAYYDGRIAAEAMRQLGHKKDRPFFLAVGFWKPHAPFNAPKKYWDLYATKKLPPFNPARPTDAPEWAFHDNAEILGWASNKVTPTPAQVAEMRHGYFANISYMDAQVGKVLKAIDEYKLAEKTVIVFLADHGYHVGEHTLWGKTSCFELDARVPLLIATPGMKTAGKATPALVELLDLFPTLTALCALKTPEGLEGTSLVPILADPTRTVKAGAFTQHPRPQYSNRKSYGDRAAMGYSVRTASSRYTEWRDWTSGKLLGAEFYDHVRDPHERTNRVEASKDADELKNARQALHKQFPPEIPPSKR